jgi:hypothetical protein
MNQLDCLFERPANLLVGTLLTIIALGFSVVGITILPVLGLLIAVPIFVAAAAFFTASKSQACTL